MKIFKLLRLTALALLTIISVSTVKAGDVTLVPGDVTGYQGSVINLPILLNNGDTEIVSLQFDMVISTDDVIYGDPVITGRINSGFTKIDKNPSGPGQRVILYDTANTPFSGTEGAVLNIPLTIADPGEYTVTLSGFAITKKDLSMLYPKTPQSATITVTEAEAIRYGENQLYVKDITINQGENATMYIGYNSASDVYGYSVEIVLPEGVSVSSLEFTADVTGIKGFNNTYSFSAPTLNVEGSQSGNKPKQAPEGDIIVAMASLNTSSLAPGEYTITVQSQYLANDDEENDGEYSPETYTAKLTVKGAGVTVNLVDGTPYTNAADQVCAAITYTRTYTGTNWQALYLPFAMEYDDWVALGDIAKLNNVHQYDTDGDGKLDKTTLEFNSVTDAIEANTPYVFRPKIAGEVKFDVSDAILKAAPATDAYVDCSSTESVYTIYGTYEIKDGLYADGAYALSPAGQFVQAASPEQTLNPYRIYMIITDKHYGSSSQKAPARISITVDGETTGIDDVEIIQQVDGRCYDLLGRPVANPQNGIYIRGGQKVMVK